MQYDVIVFGDELGIPAVAQKNIKTALGIIDPCRKGFDVLQQWNSLPLMAFPDRENRELFCDKLKACNPQVAIVFSFSRILWPALINLFPKGVINIHLSKLPQYRGANTLQWTLINGETTTAATLHYIEDEGIDTGPIIAERAVEISPADTAVTLQKKLLAAADTMMEEWLPRLLRGRVAAKPQLEEYSRSWPRRSPKDGLLTASLSEEEIHNMLRALLPPWPGAYYLDHHGNAIVIDHLMSIDEVRTLKMHLQQIQQKPL